MRSRFISSAAAAAVVAIVGSSAARADLVVDTELGTLGAGAHAFSGTTLGATNDVDTYSTMNTAAIWDQDFTYRFTTTSSLLATLATNDPDNNTLDNDFFLLSSPTTSVNANGLRQATPIGEGIFTSGSFGVIPAGTYFFTVDAWRGNPTVAGTPPTGRAGAYAGTLTLATITQPSATQTVMGGSLTGSLGAAEIHWFRFDYSGSGGFVLDTEGSVFTPQNDTELGLFNADGILVANDDDGGTGALSRIASPAGLPAGTYFLAIGGFNVEFDDGFQAVSDPTIPPDFGSYVINGISVPEPTALALAPLAALACVRRRRR